MTALARTIVRMIDIRRIVIARMEELGIQPDELATRIQKKHGDSSRSIHYFLEGQRDGKPTTLNSKALAHVLDELRLDVTPKK